MNLTVKQWSRLGRSRLYVVDSHDSTVGWVDLDTGEQRLNRPDLAEVFESAITDFCVERSITLPLVPEQRRAQGLAHSQVRLADNRPGEQAAQEARRAWSDRVTELGPLRAWWERITGRNNGLRVLRHTADGERWVGAKLNQLRTSPGWYVMHGLDLGGAGLRIDHLVIGPPGVFCVTTRNHPHGRIVIDAADVNLEGRATGYLADARFRAERAELMLSRALADAVPVTPALVLLTGSLVPKVEVVPDAPTDVMLLDRLDVPHVFTRSADRISESYAGRVYDAARLASTWQLSRMPRPQSAPPAGEPSS